MNVVTSPEIEILIIIDAGHYDKFKKKSSIKPSSYCKNILRMSKIKSYDFVKSYFNDCNKLVYAIIEYARVTKHSKDYLTLYDLLKK